MYTTKKIDAIRKEINARDLDFLRSTSGNMLIKIVRTEKIEMFLKVRSGCIKK
jgi:hypothetical protein